jgi:CheY-like chemotaxis protein
MERKTEFLLIEDNLIDQLVIKELFKKKLSIDTVHIANNGKEGLEWLHKNKNNCASILIILDIMMPVMNGLEFLCEYDKLDEELKNITNIYMLSSTLDPDEIKQIKENKYVQKILSKPFPIEEFSKTYFQIDVAV